MDKYEIESLLMQISSLLKDKGLLASCDRFAGQGQTEKMYRSQEERLAKRYTELLDAEFGFHIKKEKQTTIPQWQKNYDLL